MKQNLANNHENVIPTQGTKKIPTMARLHLKIIPLKITPNPGEDPTFPPSRRGTAKAELERQ